MAVIIDGKAIAEKITGKVVTRVKALQEKGIKPALAVILVGEDPASVSYVTGKEKALFGAGMEGIDIRLPSSTSEDELLKIINKANEDSKIHGILVQLPLPPQINADRIISAIDPNKDVDGFHPLSAGNLLLGKPGFLPCTPHGILRLLNETGIPVAGSNTVILGRSNLVGKPLALLLSRKEYNATVTLCHTGTSNLEMHTKNADILVAALGSPLFVKADMIKEGAAVIDVGVNRIEDSSRKKGFRLCGDTDYEEAEKKAGWITPVPGGVGPMTIAMLMENVVLAAEKLTGNQQ